MTWVLREPTAIAGTWQVFDGEFLLTVVPVAWKLATGQEWTHDSPASYETGTNTSTCPDIPTGELASIQRRSEPSEAPSRASVRFELTAGDIADSEHFGGFALPGLSWLYVDVENEESLPRRDEFWYSLMPLETVCGFDPAWARWWDDNAPSEDLVISIRLVAGPTVITPALRRGRRTTRLSVTLDGTPISTATRTGCVELARQYLTEALSAASDTARPAGAAAVA